MNLRVKELIGLDPSDLKRRIIFGGLIIVTSGFFAWGAIFYSFILAFNSVTLMCPVPDETINIMSEFFTFPILIVGLYMSLIATILYYVNPWERLK